MSALSLSEATELLHPGATYDRVCIKFSNSPHERENRRMQEVLERAASTDTKLVTITWFPGDGISFELTFDPTTVTVGDRERYYITVPGHYLVVSAGYKTLNVNRNDRVPVELNDDLRLVPTEAFRSVLPQPLKV